MTQLGKAIKVDYECPIHGMTPHYTKPNLNGSRRRGQCCKCNIITQTQWKKDNPDRLRKIADKRNLKSQYRKALAREHLGGKCSNPNCNHNCPTNRLQFDHIDPNDKDHDIAFASHNNAHTPELFWEEVDKCRLLCPICHEKHTWNTIPTHEDALALEDKYPDWKKYRRENCGFPTEPSSS